MSDQGPGAARGGRKSHAHEFHGLWAHWGPFGPQDEHYHPCFNERCRTVLVGPGRNCDGTKATHREKKL